MDNRNNNDSEIESNGRKARQGGFEGPTDEKCSEYIKKLLVERDSLNPERYPTILALIQKELDQLCKGAQGIVQDNGYIDLYNDTPITLYVKALPPTKIFPKFNYAGRIIGPKGTYLKALMKETMTKMILLGKGVMKDKEKEEQLRSGTDPKYYHLNEDMHVAIQVTGPASEAYAKISYALKCLKQQVLSDNRGLEDLPWISGATGALMPGSVPRGQMDGGMVEPMVKHQRQHSPPPQGLTRQSSSSSRSTYPPRNSSYDYQEDAYQYSYDYPREPSPTPTHQGHSSSGKSPYYTSQSYVRRPPPQQPESSRVMDYTDKVRIMRPTHTSHPHSTHGSTRANSPGMRGTHIDYGHGGANLYEQDPVPQHYYETDGRSGSWSSSDLYPSKNISMDRGGRSSWTTSSQSQRYAPYSKK